MIKIKRQNNNFKISENRFRFWKYFLKRLIFIFQNRTNLEEEVSKIKEKDQEPVVRLSWAERPPKISKKKQKPEASPVVRQNPAERSPG